MNATATPSASLSTKKSRTAPRLARATTPAARRLAREEAARAARAELRRQVLALLEERRPAFLAIEDVMDALDRDHDPVLDVLADLSNEEIDSRRLGGEWEYTARRTAREVEIIRHMEAALLLAARGAEVAS